MLFKFELFMEFLSKMIDKTAIDVAKENKHLDIVKLLSKGPIKTKEATKSKSKQDKPKSIIKSHPSSSEVDSLVLKNQQLEEENSQLKEKNRKLEEYLFALKEKSTELDFFNFKDYKVKSVIGEGSTSNVKLVVKDEEYAMKELKDSNHKTVQRFFSEGEVMFILRHPCILDIIAVNYGDNEHPPSLILSLEPKNLESAIANKELDDMLKCRITVEVVLGMRYIHRRNYMHRDLKPSNILLSKENHVRISDFGLAKEEDLETSQSKGVGTLRFMAPELFVEEDDDTTHYTNKVDVYSFGITLFYIVNGSYMKFNMKNVVNGVVPQLPSNIVKWVRELIVKCLSPVPENRPSFAEIFETLKKNNYDLFSENNGAKLTKQKMNMLKEIEARILKIEAFEFQHKND